MLGAALLAAGCAQVPPPAPPGAPSGAPDLDAAYYRDAAGTGARVYRVTWVTYRVDAAGYRTPCLTRRNQGSAPQVVATDVSAFHVWYRLQDNTETRDPVDLSLIDKIRPVIETQVADRGSTFLTDSVWTLVRPRTF